MNVSPRVVTPPFGLSQLFTTEVSGGLMITTPLTGALQTMYVVPVGDLPVNSIVFVNVIIRLDDPTSLATNYRVILRALANEGNLSNWYGSGSVDEPTIRGDWVAGQFTLMASLNGILLVDQNATDVELSILADGQDLEMLGASNRLRGFAFRNVG